MCGYLYRQAMSMTPSNTAWHTHPADPTARERDTYPQVIKNILARQHGASTHRDGVRLDMQGQLCIELYVSANPFVASAVLSFGTVFAVG
jgi:hypothetical protein